MSCDVSAIAIFMFFPCIPCGAALKCGVPDEVNDSPSGHFFRGLHRPTGVGLFTQTLCRSAVRRINGAPYGCDQFELMTVSGISCRGKFSC